MDKWKPCVTPISTTLHISVNDECDFEDPFLYWSIVGGLQYLAFTRPDIAYSIHRVSKFMHNPKVSHWQTVKRILRFLKHAVSYGLFISRHNSLQFQAFSNADWAGDHDNWRSIGAYYIFLGQNLVSSIMQTADHTIAWSNTETDYKSLANVAAKLLRLQSLTLELGIHMKSPVVSWCNNIEATYLSTNPMFQAWIKHIEINFYFVRDLVANNKLLVRFINSRDQLPNLLTKPLVVSCLKLFSFNLSVWDLSLRLRGRIEEQLLPNSKDTDSRPAEVVPIT